MHLELEALNTANNKSSPAMFQGEVGPVGCGVSLLRIFTDIVPLFRITLPKVLAEIAITMETMVIFEFYVTLNSRNHRNRSLIWKCILGVKVYKEVKNHP